MSDNSSQAASVEDGIKFEPIDKLFPSIDFFLHQPILGPSPSCSYADLSNGNLSILDLFILNEIVELRGEVSGKK